MIRLTRILFLVGPIKRSAYERMAEQFSPRIVYEFLTPTYPSTHPTRTDAARLISDKVFGDKALRGRIEDFEPDVVFTDTMLYGAHAKLQACLAGRSTPLVLHLHGDWWQEYWSWFSRTTWRGRFQSSQQYAYNWVSLCLARKVLPVCRWLENVTHHYLPTAETEVVYMGVDPNEFYPDHKYRLKRPAVAIIQNHNVFPKAQALMNFETIVRKLPNVHFYITEGQSTRQQFLGAVKETFSSCQNVHFLGGIHNPASVRGLLGSVDCYVLVTNLDCCPVTVLEASLMRLPVIASRVCGVPETILNKKTGWTVNNDSTEEWVDRINQIIADPKLGNRVGEEGRTWVLQKFAWKTIARQVENLLTIESQS